MVVQDDCRSPSPLAVTAPLKPLRETDPRQVRIFHIADSKSAFRRIAGRAVIRTRDQLIKSQLLYHRANDRIRVTASIIQVMVGRGRMT